MDETTKQLAQDQVDNLFKRLKKNQTLEIVVTLEKLEFIIIKNKKDLNI